jgi:shikimate dehydrogenase
VTAAQPVGTSGDPPGTPVAPAEAARQLGTRVAGVVGDPVRHSLSPRLHEAAYRALGLDWTYLAFEVGEVDFEAAVAGARALSFVGLSVTMPHKQAAAALATRRSMTVRRLGAANTLSFSGRQVVADNTDGAGLLDDLRQLFSFDPDGRRCGVIGAGGAARAAVLALAEAGAREVLVVNRSATHAFRAASLARSAGRVVRPVELDAADVVVQATPATMEGDGPELVDSSRFGSGQIVLDLVYDPPLSPWLARAAANGARTANGRGVLVRQAARQIELWAGTPAPIETMWAAIGGRAGPVPPEGDATRSAHGA